MMTNTEHRRRLPALAADNCDDDEKLLESSISEDKPFDRLIKPTRCYGCTVVVEPLLFIFMLTQYPLIILLPQYYQRREWENLMGNASYPDSHNACVGGQNESENYISGNMTLAASAASLFALQANLASTIPAIPAVLFLGPYSDRVGRRIALLLPLVGQTLSTLCTVLTVYFVLPLQFILIGSFINGLCGYWVTLIMAAIAYITDITPKEKRSFRIVMAEICCFAPTIITVAGSGFWIDMIGFMAVFFIILMGNVAILLYAVFLVPETIRKDSTARFFSLEYTKRAITVITSGDDKKRRWKLLTMLLVFLLYMTVGLGYIETLFIQNQPLCWGAVLIGIYSAIKVGVGVIGSGISSKVLSWVIRDAWIVVAALVLGASGNLFKYFVVSTPMMFISAVFNIMSVVSTPTLRSMMSKLVSPSDFGAVFSCVAVVEVICQLLGSCMLNPIYSATVKEGASSAVFLVVTGVYIVALIVMLTFAIRTRKDPEKETEEQTQDA